MWCLSIPMLIICFLFGYILTLAPFYTHLLNKKTLNQYISKGSEIVKIILWPQYISAISGANSRTMHCLIKSSLDVIYIYNSKVDWQFQFKMIREGKENLIFTAWIALMPTKKRGKFQSNIKLNLTHVIMMKNLIFFLCKKWK